MGEAVDEDVAALAGDAAALPPARRRRVPWGLLAKTAVTLGLAWLIADKVDLAAVADRFATIDALWLTAALLLFLLQYAMAALRWELVLRALGQPLPPRRLVEIFMIGLFFNQALPSSIGGDALRIWRSYTAGLALGRAVSSVLLDRALGFVALFLLAALALPFGFALFGDHPLRWAPPALTLFAFLSLALLLSLDRLLPASWHRLRVVRGLAGLARDGRLALLEPRSLAALTVVSLLAALAAVGVFYALAQALGVTLDLLPALVLVPVIFTVTAVPISLAGWGLREGAAIFLLGLVAVSEADALALSLCYGLLAALTSLPGGAVWLLTRERDQKSARP